MFFSHYIDHYVQCQQTYPSFFLKQRGHTSHYCTQQARDVVLVVGQHRR